jgi:hypothetical protein
MEVVDHTMSHERGNSSVAGWEKETHEDEEAFEEQDTSPSSRVYVDTVETEELPSEAMDGSLGSDQKQPFVRPARSPSFPASSNRQENPHSSNIPPAALSSSASASVPGSTPVAASAPNRTATWQQGATNTGAFNQLPQYPSNRTATWQQGATNTGGIQSVATIPFQPICVIR